MKKKNTLFWLFCFIDVLFLVCSAFFFIEGRKAFKNVENSRKILIGQNIEEVIRIMGEPDEVSIDKINGHGIDTRCLFYEPPIKASEGIYIHFDMEKDTVIHISYMALRIRKSK